LFRLEEAGVLDGDYGLVREGCDELDLLISEGLLGLTLQRDDADWYSFP
jgi:hypothetical protein